MEGLPADLGREIVWQLLRTLVQEVGVLQAENQGLRKRTPSHRQVAIEQLVETEGLDEFEVSRRLGLPVQEVRYLYGQLKGM